MATLGYRCLRRAELPAKTVELARWLLGKTLVRDSPRGRMSGRIVETEAYLTGDAASHTFRGQTPRTQSMFLERGHAYVYFIYGTWFALNVSSEAEGVGEAVLLRALEPLEGIDLMQRRRPHVHPRDFTRGPGRLASAMDIDRRFDGLNLCRPGPLWLGTPARHRRGPVTWSESVRIGVTQEAHRVLRFFEKGSPWLSGPKKLNTGVC